VVRAVKHDDYIASLQLTVERSLPASANGDPVSGIEI